MDFMSHNQTYEETARKISYHPVPAHSRNVKVTAVFFSVIDQTFLKFFLNFSLKRPEKIQSPGSTKDYQSF